MSGFEVHPDGHATIGGVPFYAGANVRIFNDFCPPPAYAFPCERGTRIRGVQIVMANGLELSIMWGTSNYCEVRDDPDGATSPNAEIALFGQHGDIIGEPASWVSAADVLAAIPAIAAADPRRQLSAGQHLVAVCA